MPPRRRTFLQSIPIVAMPIVAGCSRQEDPPSVALRLVRVINLSETDVSIELVASHESGMTETLYSGEIRTQGPTTGDGEVVLQPKEITEPLEYDYLLTISDTHQTKLHSEDLQSAHQRESSERPMGCVELSFTIRDPATEAEIGGDYTFWKSCDTAPGSVESTTSS